MIEQLNLHKKQENSLRDICALSYYHYFEDLKKVSVLYTDEEKSLSL